MLNMGRNLVLVLAAVPAIVFLLIAYSPYLLDIDPAYISIEPPPPLVGPLKPNKLLQKAEKLLKHNIEGPESLAFFRGDLYTGLRNGWIVRIKNDHIIEPIVSLGKPSCEDWEEEECGRPLGLRFHRNGTLFVVDGYQGIFNVDVQTGSVKNIYDSSQPVDGKRPRFLNDFDMMFKAGNIYFSEISSKYPINESIFNILESTPHGRILHHNIFNKTTRTLVDGLASPNGVQLSPNKNFLLISETGKNRVLKYHLIGKKAGKLEVFIDNLPGAPDNIRSNGRDGYWLPLFAVYSKQHIMMKLGSYPTIRKVIARVISMLRSTLFAADYYFKIPFCKIVAKKIATLEPYLLMEEQYGMILELNDKGEIIRSLQDPDGSFSAISEVAQLGNALYFGSAWNRYLGKLTFDKYEDIS